MPLCTGYKEDRILPTQIQVASDELIEQIEDLIHDVEGNDGLDIHTDLEDDFYVNFEETDFSALEV